MNRDVLLDSIARTAKDLEKYRKSYEKYISRPVGPNDLWRAEKYIELLKIQKGLLKQLEKYR